MKYSDYTQAMPIAHWMPWHLTKGHVPLLYLMPSGEFVPYDSANLQICLDQCRVMQAQDIKAINIDYYGPDSPSATAALRMLNACEMTGLGISLCIDHGAVENAADPTAEYAHNLLFAQEVFFTSPNYVRDNGRPIVNFFGDPPHVDWAKVRSSIKTPIAMIFQSFAHPEADGAFGWVAVGKTHNDINKPAVDAFVSAAAAHPDKIAMYPVYPGFDDSLASWGKGRSMTRGVDKTLKTTLSWVPAAAKYVLIETWNDHEEGTGIEPGVMIA